MRPIILLLLALPLVAACSAPKQVDPSQVAFERPPEPNPFHATQLVADFGKPDAPVDTIRFDDSPPAEEPHIVGLEQAIAGYTAAFNDSDAKLDRVLIELAEIKRAQLTKDDVREVVHEELEAFKQVLIEWKDASGKVSTAAVPVDAKGVGTVTLPPGAVVTAMGGVPLEQWKLSNPGAAVPDGSVGGGSSGGSVSSRPVATTYQPQAIPMAVAHWESEVAAPVQYYASPGQFAASVGEYDDHTQFSTQVAPQYMLPSSPGNQCYIDQSTGQQVCPNAVQATASAPRKGLFGRLRGR